MHTTDDPHPPAVPSVRPWYRHPWPFLLMLAPGVAIVWGSSTMWIAYHYQDPLVTEHAWQDGQDLQAGKTVQGVRAEGVARPAVSGRQ